MYNTKRMPEYPLHQSFYYRQVVEVAIDLIGKRLVRQMNGFHITGLICETEAYDGMSDLACHARVGKTNRTAVMFGPPGFAYVYFTYGMHWCFNVVTGEEGYAAAVLIRAIIPESGLEFIANNRQGIDRKQWVNGPAKLTKALMIDKSQNGVNLSNSQSGLWIEEGNLIDKSCILQGPRIGIERTPEPWRSKPWRFWVEKS